MIAILVLFVCVATTIESSPGRDLLGMDVYRFSSKLTFYLFSFTGTNNMTAFPLLVSGNLFGDPFLFQTPRNIFRKKHIIHPFTRTKHEYVSLFSLLFLNIFFLRTVVSNSASPKLGKPVIFCTLRYFRLHFQEPNCLPPAHLD
jgi:hypothetical protein